MTRHSKKKLDSINALANHFRHIHNQVESKNFGFFAVVKDRKPGIYNYGLEVLQQVERFPDLFFKGFYILEEALNLYRGMIGFNFYISERVRQTMQPSSTQALSSYTTLG